MKHTKHLLFLLLLMLALPAFAQHKAKFHIVSFAENPHDTSPQIYEKLDSDGHSYAIIKVKSNTPDDNLRAYNFSFALIPHIVEVRDGELWVYVGRNAKSVSISRDGYQSVQRYDLGLTIQPGRAYEMQLSVEPQKIMKQMVRFNISPVEAKAIVMYKSDRPGATEQLFGTADDNGAVAKNLELGKYSYKIISDNCYPSEGVLILDNANATHTEDVVLRANFARVSLVAGNGVSIFVDGDNKGVGSWNGILKEGTYSIECRKAGHKSTMETLKIEEGKDVTLTLSNPEPITGTLSITSTPLDAVVTIDGKDYGFTPRSINNVVIGNHKVVVSKEGYKSQEFDVAITENEVFERSVTLRRVEKGEPQFVENKNSSTQFKVSVPRDPYALLCIACVNKDDGSIAYFTGNQWEVLSANELSKYAQLGVSVKKDGHELIISSNECRNPVSGKFEFKFGGYGIDFAGVRSYEKTAEVKGEFIKTGLNDTKAIIEQTRGRTDSKGIEGAPAAEAAWNYRANEHDRLQWYLPSYSELMIIYENRKVINKFLEKYFSSYDKIRNRWYWSSTEYDNKSSWMATMNIGGGTHCRRYRDDPSVRAVAIVR